MDEHDEVEVLGDFTLEHLFSKTENSLQSNYESVELLHSDFSPPSGHWFLESNLNSFWSITFGSDSEERASFSNFSTSPQSKFLDSLNITNSNVWSNKEKYLLEKGLELFGRSWSRLSQYIGSKSSSQIKAYLKNMDNHSAVNASGSVNPSSSIVDPLDLSGAEIINDMQIPASVEEVISAVSTGQPTVPTRKNSKHQYRSKRKCRPSSESLSDSDSNDGLYNVELNFNPKDKVSRKRNRAVSRKNKSSSFRRQMKVKPRKQANINLIKPKEEVSQFHIKIAESNSNKNCVVLPSGEEVVKIKPEYSTDEMDIDIDVEDVSDYESKQDGKTLSVEEIAEFPVEKNLESNVGSSCSHEKQQSNFLKHLTNIREKISAIYELPPPIRERTLGKLDCVTEEEKKYHPEFFMKNDPILISRYMKIRNHIYNSWLSNRPNYVNKTAIRSGLKGDVNLISRIHAYLEQMGYINFGCEQCHYNQEKSPSIEKLDVEKPDEVAACSRRSTTRTRNKIYSYSSLLETPTKLQALDEGGCTIQHVNSNETVISCFGSGQTLVSSSEKPIIDLIPCNLYSESEKAPFKVLMHLKSLILVDVHAHASPTKEIMGLLGGKYDYNTRELSLITSLPCRAVESSQTHCDMCPISQSEASNEIYGMGQDVVGWYHSHPSFPPDPSDQDLETQKTLQRYFSKSGLPFIGLIISPYLSTNNFASVYQCLKVEINTNNEVLPYKLECQLFQEVDSNICSLIPIFIKSALLSLNRGDQKKAQIIERKVIQSIEHHLESLWLKFDEELKKKVLENIEKELVITETKGYC